MLNFNDFRDRNLNKYVEVVDPTAPNQCVDLTVKWTDNLGIPRVFPFYWAYQIFTNFGAEQAKYFDRIFNSANNSPKEGDIVVFSWYYNNAGGHVGVATGKGQSVGKPNDWFEMFSQNDPTGKPCILKNYNYSYVLGWLHPKNYISVPSGLNEKEYKLVTTVNKLNGEQFKAEFKIAYGV